MIQFAFSSAGIPNILQPPGISIVDGKRPDGMTLIPWSRGKSLFWDVTIPYTLAPSSIHLSSQKTGSAAEQAEHKKHSQYISLKENHNFTPIAFESLGSCGPETKIFMERLGKLLKQTTGDKRSLDFLFQKISITITIAIARFLFLVLVLFYSG